MLKTEAGRKQKKLKALEEKDKKEQKRLDKLIPKLLVGKEHNQYPSIKGFVIFNLISHRNDVIKKYKHHWRWTCMRICCNCLWDIKK